MAIQPSIHVGAAAMRLSSGALQPATPRPDDPAGAKLLHTLSPSHAAVPDGHGKQHQDVKRLKAPVNSAFDKQHDSVSPQLQPPSKQEHTIKAVRVQHKQQELPMQQAKHAAGASEALLKPQAPAQPPAKQRAQSPTHAPAAAAGTGGKPKSPKHRPSTVVRLSQQAIRCLESYEHKLLLELQSILSQSAATTAASAAAGAAVGAGAAVAAAEQALAGRVALIRGGLLSPEDSARSARAAAMQEFCRQPGSVCALELQAQMVAQLEAAEAKLHVHRTAATSAKVKIQQLEELVQQLQLKHQQQQEQLSHQQQHMDTQQEALQQQEHRLLQQDQELQQQYQLAQQQRQELALRDQQVAAAEAQVQSLREQLQQLQQQELSQWRGISSYASLDEQELRQQQEQLLQDREEHETLEQQLRWRQEELQLQQQQVQQLQEQQQAQLLQLRTEAQALQQQQEGVLLQQQQLEHQQQEVQLMQQQVEQQRQDLAAQQQLLHDQQALLEQQEVQVDASQRQLSLSVSLHDIMSAQALQVTQVQASTGLEHMQDIPLLPLPLCTVPEQGLLQQVAQTLASASPSPAGAAPLAVVHSTHSTVSFAEGTEVLGAAEPCAEEEACGCGMGSDSMTGTAVAEAPQEQQPAQQEASADEGQHTAKQRPPLPPHLTDWGSPSEPGHRDWQVIVSPSNMEPAEERHYHASTFSRVLQHLDSANSDKGTDSGAVQPQQRDFTRVAEYMEALAADNTVLSCEVFHLQQLLVEQRRSASSSCEAVARKLASEALKLTWELQQAELQLELQQAAFDAVRSYRGSHVQQPVGPSAVVVDGEAEAEAEGGTSSRDGEGMDVLPAAGETSAERMNAICEVVLSRMSGLLAQHEAKVQGLIEQLDKDVDACCTHYDEAANTAELEQQLSQFEQVYELMLHESENGLLQETSAQQDTPAPGPNTAPVVIPAPSPRAAAATAAAAAVAAGLTGSSDRGVLASPRTPGDSKPFVTSPSGHVSLLPSRRTSGVQPPSGLSSSRPSSAHQQESMQQQQQQQQQRQRQQQGLGASKTVASILDPAAAAHGPAAALLQRRSHLAELLIGQVGLTHSSSSAAGTAAQAAAGPAAAVSANAALAVGEAGVRSKEGENVGVQGVGDGRRVSRLVQLLQGQSGSLASSVDTVEPQNGLPGNAAASGSAMERQEAGTDSSCLSQQQQQQPVQAYARSRGKTCDVLTQVAARLKGTAAADAPDGGAADVQGMGLSSAAEGAGLGAEGQEEAYLDCCEELSSGQQQQQWLQEEGDGRSWETGAAAMQQLQLQQDTGEIVSRPAPSPSALLLVQAIFEASLKADAQL